MAEFNDYGLTRFELMKYRQHADGTYRVVVYGTGQWTGHIMDWAGCNFIHGRLPNSPVFNSIDEAETWLKTVWPQHKDEYVNADGGYSGHHAGEYRCSKGCDDRRIKDVSLPSLQRITQATSPEVQ